MSWLLLLGLVLGLCVAFLAAVARRSELTRMQRGLAWRELETRAGAEGLRRLAEGVAQGVPVIEK